MNLGKTDFAIMSFLTIAIFAMTANYAFAQTETVTETQFVLPFDTDILNQGTFMMIFVIIVVSFITIMVIKHMKQR